MRTMEHVQLDPLAIMARAQDLMLHSRVIDYRLAFLTKGECPPSGLSPHTDTLDEFPYLGTPH